MAKTLDEAGVKRLIQEIKGANKDLNTPIPISTENTTESMAQNVKNIADYVEKAKATGIANVNGICVTCSIYEDYYGIGYLADAGGYMGVQGVLITDDLIDNMCFTVNRNGLYTERGLIVSNDGNALVNSGTLDLGARKPIILTSETTEVDEKTYQKLLSGNDDVDVIFKTNEGEFCTLTYITNDDTTYYFYFACFSFENETKDDVYIFAYEVSIAMTTPHTCTIRTLYDAQTLRDLLQNEDHLDKSSLSSVLQEINLTGTDADRKVKLDQFEKDWKALTGASDLSGARFVGFIEYRQNLFRCLLCFNSERDFYSGIAVNSDDSYNDLSVSVTTDGYLQLTPLFSHLEAITIKPNNSTTSKAANVAAIKEYVDNLETLGVDITKGFLIPISVEGQGSGFISRMSGINSYNGVMISYGIPSFGIYVDAAGGYHEYKLQTKTDNSLTTTSKKIVSAINEVYALAQGVKAFGAIELKASDDAANKTALAAYLKILTDAQVDTTNGYSVPVRITGNSQEYHGMLNIGTGALLSGVVTDVNENHHYPFNVSTTDGAILFDENNYFLEKASNEVTEMLDAIKYSYTAVPFTDTTLSNKAQLEVFLSKVPNATVMHCTYKEIWAGTLHKINGDWYGLLVKNTNSPSDNINIKLSADGTVITSNSAQ